MSSDFYTIVNVRDTDREHGINSLKSTCAELNNFTLKTLKNMDNAQAKALLEICKRDWSTFKTKNDWSSIPIVYTLQYALGASVDGVIGPQTRNKVKAIIIGISDTKSLFAALDAAVNGDMLIANVSEKTCNSVLSKPSVNDSNPNAKISTLGGRDNTRSTPTITTPNNVINMNTLPLAVRH